MQPSRKREGKSAGEGVGNTVGMQPSRKREGKSAGKGVGNTVGMQPSAKAEGKPGETRAGRESVGERGMRHSWALARARGEAREKAT
ncbi:MAG: hypothetical protein KatS3mg005_1235 [Bryobacteraceae bacterium]|nr:MAG: hypothetical protein KatS3mg005_1235 [Bryobacteraceae bacterium]